MQGAVMDLIGITNESLKTFLSYFRWIFLLSLIFFTFGFIYKYAPAVTKRWKIVSPGTILGSFMSILATWGFSFFVNTFGKYNAFYGSIGTVIVLMALVFINSLILLIGYELNASIHSLKAMAEKRELIEKNGRQASIISLKDIDRE
jgi:membrane protein